MGDVSNSTLVCRLVQKGEIEAALRLILATSGGLGADAQVLDFLSFCVERKIDTNAIWIALAGDQIVWSMLPVVSPGRTMLIFSPSIVFPQIPSDAIGRLSDELCRHHAKRGVQLAQMLLDPADRPAIDAYCSNGFEELAELVYLQRSIRTRGGEIPGLPVDLSIKSYTHDTHHDFANVIHRSYEQSLDCPALNNMRDMNDVIAGHKAAGEFDPKLWWVLYERDQPLAVLLLSRIPQGATMELVYLGLAPTARGRGIGDLLMQHAFAVGAAEGLENLSLAVDSRNEPALRLYYRHGLRKIGSRTALLRDLRVSGYPIDSDRKSGSSGVPSNAGV
jgi:mycothiol synthase